MNLKANLVLVLLLRQGLLSFRVTGPEFGQFFMVGFLGKLVLFDQKRKEKQ